MVDSDSEKDNKLKLFGKFPLSDALLLASIPVFAYSIVFFFNWGYLAAFDLPTQFISFGIGDIFLGFVALTGLGWTLFGAINLIFSFLPRYPSPPIARRLRILTPFLLIFLADFFWYNGQSQQWIFLLCVNVIVALIVFASPLLDRKEKGSYLQKLESIDSKTVNDPFEGSLISRFASIVGSRYFQLVAYLLLGAYLVYNAGRSVAVNQSSWRVASTNPECVVLFITSDKFICAPFDRKLKEIEPSFYVLAPTTNPNILFRFENLGPLKVKR